MEKFYLIKDMLEIANSLDDLGMSGEADKIDDIVKSAQFDDPFIKSIVDPESIPAAKEVLRRDILKGQSDAIDYIKAVYEKQEPNLKVDDKGVFLYRVNYNTSTISEKVKNMIIEAVFTLVDRLDDMMDIGVGFEKDAILVRGTIDTSVVTPDIVDILMERLNLVKGMLWHNIGRKLMQQ